MMTGWYGSVEFCAMRGYHTMAGLGTGTRPDQMVWSGVCQACGTKVPTP